jgi:hypothetical protein
MNFIKSKGGRRVNSSRSGQNPVAGICADSHEFRRNREFLDKQSTKFSVQILYHGVGGQRLLRFQVHQFGLSVPPGEEQG